MIMNSLEAYVEIGEKVAQALNDGDGSRFKFEQQHYQKMLAFEHEPYKTKARETYTAAYRAKRRVPLVKSW